MSEPLEIALVGLDDPRYVGALELRYRVLRAPLGMARGTERTAAEEACLHLVAAAPAGQVRGCVLFQPLGPERGKLLQMAVEEALRGAGVGRRLVRRLEAEALARGMREVVLDAREPAIPFYERLGYRAEGAVFLRHGIPHRVMRRRLDAPAAAPPRPPGP